MRPATAIETACAVSPPTRTDRVACSKCAPYSAETHTSAPRGFTVARTVAVLSPAAETVTGPTVAGPRPAAVTMNERIDVPDRRAKTLDEAVQSSAPYEVEPAW